MPGVPEYNAGPFGEVFKSRDYPFELAGPAIKSNVPHHFFTKLDVLSFEKV